MRTDVDVFKKEVDLMKDLVYGYEKETKDVTNLMKFQLTDVGKQMSHMKISYKDINAELLTSMWEIENIKNELGVLRSEGSAGAGIIWNKSFESTGTNINDKLDIKMWSVTKQVSDLSSVVEQLKFKTQELPTTDDVDKLVSGKVTSTKNQMLEESASWTRRFIESAESKNKQKLETLQGRLDLLGSQVKAMQFETIQVAETAGIGVPSHSVLDSSDLSSLKVEMQQIDTKLRSEIEQITKDLRRLEMDKSELLVSKTE